MRLRRRAEQSTLWQEVRPVSPPAWQDDGREVLTCDGSGLSFSACAARLVPAGSWQRTLSESLALSLTGSTGCAVSLRVRATKCGRSLLVPTMLERPTDGSESGSWPTSKGQDSYERRNQKTMIRIATESGDLTLPTAVYAVDRHLWPTARAEDSESAGAHVARGTAETLTAAARLWPTATGEDSRASGSAGYSTESGRHPGTTLTDAANGLWASPQARDWKDSGPTQGARHSFNLGSQAAAGRLAPGSPSTSGKRRGSLNPAWVSQLMGFPTGWLAASPPDTAARRLKASAIRLSRKLRK